MRHKVNEGDTVFVNTEDGKTRIFEGRIEKIDRELNIITVPLVGKTMSKSEKLSIRVMGDYCTTDYLATVRRQNSTSVEFALSHEQSSIERKFKRHSMKNKGVITDVCNGSRYITLRKPISVIVLDMSAGGLRFLTVKNEFATGTWIKMEIQMANQQTVTGFYKILRTQNEGDTYVEYGCKSEEKLEQIITNERKLTPTFLQEKKLETESMYQAQLSRWKIDWGYNDIVDVFKAGVDQGKMVRSIISFTKNIPFQYLLNILHQKPAQEDREAVIRVNRAALNCLQGIWSGKNDDELEDLVIRTVFPDMYPSQIEETVMATVAEEYAVRASNPLNASAALPLTYLEKIYFVGSDGMHDPKKFDRHELAKNILIRVRGLKVLLMDGKQGEIFGIYHNDISHPVLHLDGDLYQLENPWEIFGFVD